MSKDPFAFKTFSKRQLEVLTWWMVPEIEQKYEGIIADGSIRSGKTLSMSLSFIRWAMYNFNNQNFALCGKTVSAFKKNVWKKLKRYLRAQKFRIREYHQENLIQISKGGVTNNFYIYGGKDEGSQDLIQGATLAGVFFDEVALMPESFVNQATARCNIDGSKLFFNCNPEHALHWFKKEWIDKRDEHHLLYCHFVLDDNPSLSEKKKESFRRRYRGVFHRRFILGEWCVAEGLIYSNYDVLKDPLDSVPEALNGNCYVSIDYGTSNPCVFLLWEQGVSKTWYLTKEYYYSGRSSNRQKTDNEYLNDLIDFIGDKKPKRIVIDPSAASFIALVRKNYRVKKANNEVLSGIRFTATQMNLGKLKILKSCKNTLDEISVYSWNDEKQEDVPIKENDHAMDAMRYFAYTIMRKEGKNGITFLT